MTTSVLIVDDSSFIVDGLVALLQKKYRVLTAYGGRECLGILASEIPDIIVLDILMEPMDGWETLACIKENPATKYIPILLFSAKKITPDEAETYREQVATVLIKPVNPRELITAIETVLERERQHQEIETTWSQAGISREIIDEYLTCASNLETDKCLLAIMKKQASQLVAETTVVNERGEFMTMLEQRITAAERYLNTFFASKGLEVPSPLQQPFASPPVQESLPASEQITALEKKPVGPVIVTPVPGSSETVTVSGTDTTGPGPVSDIMPNESRSLPEFTADDPSRQPAPADPAPAHSDQIPQQDPAAVPVTPEITDSSRSGTPDTREDNSPAPDPSVWIHFPAHADPPNLITPERRPSAPIPEEKPAQVNRSKPPEPSTIPEKVPEKAPEKPVSGNREPVHAAMPDTPRRAGFFSRIIAIIAGLFSRGKY